MGFNLSALAGAIPPSMQVALAVIGGIFVLSKALGLARFISGALVMPGTSVSLLDTSRVQHLRTPLG